MMYEEKESTFSSQYSALNTIDNQKIPSKLSPKMTRKLIKSNSSPSLSHLTEMESLSNDDIFHSHFIKAKDIEYESSGDNRPTVKIKIFGKIYNALLDTGAAITVFGKASEELWSLANHIPEMSKKKSIILPNDTIIEGNSIKMIPIEYDGELKDIKTIFIKEVNWPLIMGINFFHEFSLKIIKDQQAMMTEQLFSFNEEEKIEIKEETKLRLEIIMKEFPFDDDKKIGCQRLIKHRIDTGDAKPIVQAQYSYNPNIIEKLHDVIDEWEKQGIIEKSRSSWRNPVVVVCKPNGKIRPCLDARKLNSLTKRDRLLTPNIFEALNSIPIDAKIFGRIDKNQAFLQTLLDDRDKEKTAFFIRGRGLYHFVRMPFGLSDAPATQTRLMLQIFGDLSPYVLVYFDDIIVMGRDEEHFLSLLEIVAKRLKENNLTVSREKMSLMLKRIKILGHYVDEKGLHVDETKMKYINEWPTPTNRKDIQRFLGLCNWYRRHIKNFSQISAPLSALLSKKYATKIVWSEECEKSFKKLKDVLTRPPVLRRPIWNSPMILLCDASDIGVGAALTQIDETGAEYVIEYYSAKLNENEKKFSPTEKECLAVIKAIEHFRPFIELMELRIITDHHSLKFMLNMKVTTGRLARWILKLQPYANCIEHRSGSLMKVPDALSRAPVGNSHDVGLINIDKAYDNCWKNLMRNPDRYKNHRIEGDIILIKVPFKRNQSNDDWKIFPQPKLVDEIIRHAHEENMHGSIRSTIHKIQELYYWPKMRLEVRQWVNNCVKCLAVKSANYKLIPKMRNSRVPKSCVEGMSVDVKGPLPPSGKQRHQYIVVLIDLLSRYAFTRCLRVATSENIIQFLHEIFTLYGNPKFLIHDNATQFMSAHFQGYLKAHHINPHFIPIYCPRDNPVERFNRTLGEALRLCISDYPDQQGKWTNFVHDITSCLNNKYNESTKLTPFEVFFGHKFTKDDQLTRDLDMNHKNIMKIAFENSSREFDNIKNTYNKDKSTRYFWNNEIIMVTHHGLSNAFKRYNFKLDLKWKPARIINKIVENIYRVKMLNNREIIVDISEMKKIPSNLQAVIAKLNPTI